MEGNPLTSPPFDYLSTSCGDVTSFAQVDASLRQYYQVQLADKADTKYGTLKGQADNVEFSEMSPAALQATRSKSDDKDADVMYNVSCLFHLNKSLMDPFSCHSEESSRRIVCAIRTEKGILSLSCISI